MTGHSPPGPIAVRQDATQLDPIAANAVHRHPRCNQTSGAHIRAAALAIRRNSRKQVHRRSGKVLLMEKVPGYLKVSQVCMSLPALARDKGMQHELIEGTLPNEAERKDGNDSAFPCVGRAYYHCGN